VSPVLRGARLLRTLLRRDSLTGEPVPAPLPELAGGDSLAARRQLERDLRDLQAAGWTIRKKSSAPKGRGRPAWASTVAWALLPGEALIV
jgi:hypothetical protein